MNAAEACLYGPDAAPVGCATLALNVQQTETNEGYQSKRAWHAEMISVYETA